MTDTPASPPESVNGGDAGLSTYALLNALLRYRRWIAGLTIAGALIGLVVALQTVRRYEAAARFVTSARTTRTLTGVGTDLSPIQERDPFDYYTGVLTSTEVLDAVAAATRPGGGVLRALLDLPPTADAAVVRRRLLSAQPRLESSGRNRTLPLLTLKTSWLSPDGAADLANAFMDALIDYDKKIRSQSARERMDFIEEQIEATGLALADAEKTLQEFREGNRLLLVAPPTTEGDVGAPVPRATAPPALGLRLDQLQREVGLQTELLLTLKKAYDQAKIAALDEASGVVVVDRASPPLTPLGSGRRQSVVAGLMVGLAVGVALALLLDMRRRLDLSSPEAQEFVGHVTAMRGGVGRLGHTVRRYFSPPPVRRPGREGHGEERRDE